MNTQDPISDLLVQIKNAYSAKKTYIVVFYSKLKLAIIDLLKKECFLNNYFILDENPKKIKIFLKYYSDKVPVIRKITKISKNSSRVYCKRKNLPRVLNGFGIAIISTPVGLLTDYDARKMGYGGEILCFIE